ncbi:MAG: sigma-54-dependent Fis family transcriptional regulator [Proteobacteria bacterium]|nr:sigma-54-dependent Fis family transcriptional regulator [Pseudomonadota bacterium]
MTLVDENAFFKEATLGLCRQADIEKAFVKLISYLRRYMPIDMLFLDLVDMQTRAFVNIVAVDGEKAVNPDFTTYIPKKLFSTYDKRLRNTDLDILVFNHIDIAEDFQKDLVFPNRRDQSFMLVDLGLQEDNRYLLFSVQAFGWERFDDSHARLISLLHHPIRIMALNTLRENKISTLQNMLAGRETHLDQDPMLELDNDIVGINSGLKDVMRQVRQVASVDSPVLILGETGVGKEMIANAIHQLSARKDGPFIKVNAGAIPDTLIDSELFGHEKGAFTGAIGRKKGRFERSHQGTIFLDEIGELPLPAQVRLLRVLQNGIVERVGGTEPISVDTRIISATNRSLQEMVLLNTFREDLYYRLNVFPIVLPPLRHRKQDIPLFIQHFVKRKCIKLKIENEPTVFTEDLKRLKSHPWPGNIRELENLIERSLIRMKDSDNSRYLKFESPTSEDDYSGRKPGIVPGNTILSIEEALKRHIMQVLAMTNGKIHGQNGAAEKLGINPNTLRSRMRKLGIPFKGQMKY